MRDDYYAGATTSWHEHVDDALMALLSLLMASRAPLRQYTALLNVITTLFGRHRYWQQESRPLTSLAVTILLPLQNGTIDATLLRVMSYTFRSFNENTLMTSASFVGLPVGLSTRRREQSASHGSRW